VGGLYSEDNHRASLKGAYAAALAIAAQLGDIDVTTSVWASQAVPVVEQDILRAAASAVSADGAGIVLINRGSN
jgi:hypothetical protein